MANDNLFSGIGQLERLKGRENYYFGLWQFVEEKVVEYDEAERVEGEVKAPYLDKNEYDNKYEIGEVTEQFVNAIIITAHKLTRAGMRVDDEWMALLAGNFSIS